MDKSPSILEAFKVSKLDDSISKLDGLVDKLTQWFKQPIRIPPQESSTQELKEITKSLKELIAIERVERKEGKKDDWYSTLRYDLSSSRNNEIIVLPYATVDITAVTCYYLDNDFSLKINRGEDIDFYSTMTLRDLEIETLSISNDASSGYAKIYVQGKRKRK